MSSRDIWSRSGKEPLRDLLVGALASILLHPKDDLPAYFSSPWMSDFPLFDNPFQQYVGLFLESSEEPQVGFSTYLETLSRIRPVRIITVKEQQVSERFTSNLLLSRSKNITVRYAPIEYHEKGILAPLFYLEGSMNVTYSGVNVNSEKVVFHVPDDATGKEKLALAYLEFDRFWESLI